MIDFYLCTAIRVALAKSRSPAVGRKTRPTAPLPTPFITPQNPSFFPPARSKTSVSTESGFMLNGPDL